MFNFIKEILLINRLMHPDVQISSHSKVYLNTIVNKFLMFIITCIKEGSNLNKRFKDILGSELYNHTILNCESNSGKWTSISGYINISSKKINDICIKHNVYLDENEIKFLSCAIEYMLSEILELSGNACRDNKKIRLSNDHINIAIRNDNELSDLFGIMDINITAYSKKKRKTSRK